MRIIQVPDIKKIVKKIDICYYHNIKKYIKKGWNFYEKSIYNYFNKFDDNNNE